MEQVKVEGGLRVRSRSRAGHHPALYVAQSGPPRASGGQCTMSLREASLDGRVRVGQCPRPLQRLPLSSELCRLLVLEHTVQGRVGTSVTDGAWASLCHTGCLNMTRCGHANSSARRGPGTCHRGSHCATGCCMSRPCRHLSPPPAVRLKSSRPVITPRGSASPGPGPGTASPGPEGPSRALPQAPVLPLTCVAPGDRPPRTVPQQPIRAPSRPLEPTAFAPGAPVHPQATPREGSGSRARQWAQGRP